MSKKLVLLSGPSCVGKTPMLKAIPMVYPELNYGQPVLYSSRKPRPVEKEGVDYYFRSEETVRGLPQDRYLVGKARTVWQALDLQEVTKLFETYDSLVLEIYPTLGKQFREHPGLPFVPSFNIITVFLAPVSDEEMADVQSRMGFPSPEVTMAAIMLPKLVARSQQQGKLISPAEMEDLKLRANRAYAEIGMGKEYDIILINHDGEDSRNWKYNPPIGEAGQTLRRFVEIVAG